MRISCSAMRGPIDTGTRPRARLRETAGRSPALVAILFALLALAAALWFLFARSAAPSVPWVPRHEATHEATVRSSAPELATTARSSAAPELVPTTNELAPADRERPSSFSGHFVFEDGSVPPEMSFGMEVWPRDRSVTASCPREIRERTDAQARFVVEGLCPGAYVIQPAISGLPRIQGTVQVPASGMRVELSGYLVRVRVLTRDGTPAPGSDIQHSYVRPASTDSGVRTSRWDRRADEKGEAWFGLPELGTCTLSAFLGLDTALAHEVVLSGPSRIVDVTLQLAPASSGAALRVEVSDCASPKVLVQDFCIELLDPETRAQVARPCTQDDQPAQAFTDLRPGRYIARPVLKYLGRPVLYRLSKPAAEAVVELVEGRETSLRLCVELGGRLSVMIQDGDAQAAPDTAVPTTLMLEPDGDTPPLRLLFRTPDDTGVTVSDLALGTERVTENVLVPGTYTLVASAKG